MDTPSELPPDADTLAPTEMPVEEPELPPIRILGLQLGALVSFCALIGASAWLWSRATGDLGRGAPLLGAGIGLAIACLVRAFC